MPTPQTQSHAVLLQDPPDADELRDEIEQRLDDLAIRVVPPDEAPTPALRDAEVVLSFDPLGERRRYLDSVAWVQALTAGVDGYDLDWFRDRGIALTNASGVAAEPIAEQVLGYLLLFERQLHRAVRQQERGAWDWFGGRELRDETVGIVGVGATGGRVAELAAGLGCEVIATTRDGSCDHPVVDRSVPTDEIATMLAAADYTVLTCPLTAATRGLIGPPELRAMPDHAVLVNVSRGALVDQAALAASIQGGTIRGAALDVFETEPLPAASPLWDLDEVVITPHNAGSTPHYWSRNATLFARNYDAYRTDSPLTNRVV
jgi:phosphoglycerate dehydrogenase-like enzyme